MSIASLPAKPLPEVDPAPREPRRLGSTTPAALVH